MRRRPARYLHRSRRAERKLRFILAGVLTAGWFSAVSFSAVSFRIGEAAAADQPPAPAPAPVSFHRSVRGLLQRRCQGCHQPAKRGGKLDLTTFEALTQGGRKGAELVPGKPDESLLYLVLTGSEKPQMPKGENPLSAEEIELIRRWIAEGAKDDTPESARATLDLSKPPVYNVPPVVSSIAFSPDGSLLAAGGYHEVTVHRLTRIDPAATPAVDAMRVGRLVGLSSRIETLAFSPDGKLLAAVGGSPGRFGEVQVWSVEESRLTQSALVGFDSLYGAAFSDDGKRLAFGATDKSAQIYSLEEGKVLRRIDQHEDWVFGTGFSKDGKNLITASRDRTLKLIESDTGSFIDNITSITPGVLGGPLYTLARHPTEDKFLTAGEDGTPKLYKIVRTAARQIGDDNNLLQAYEKVPGTVTCVAFDATGARIAVGSSLGLVRLYETATGKKQSETKLPGAVYTARFHPSGLVGVGGFDGVVRFLDAQGKLVGELVPVPIGPPEVVRSF